MDKGSQTELTVQRMPQGGYLVTRRGYTGEINSTLFAATDIKDALKYVQDMIVPVPLDSWEAKPLRRLVLLPFVLKRVERGIHRIVGQDLVFTRLNLQMAAFGTSAMDGALEQS